MRLIDADCLIKHRMSGEIGDLSGDFVPGFAIAQAPTIEAEPVRHGYWIPIRDSFGKYFHKCSLCSNVDNKTTAVVGHYCWFCGAKMDAEGT